MSSQRIHEPAWKSEYIDSMSLAKDFLERNFTQTQDEPVKVTKIGTSLYVDTMCSATCLLHCASEVCGSCLHIDEFKSPLSGHDHSLMGVKAELGVMKGTGAQWLIAKNVSRRGSGFWAHLGFLPLLQKHDSLLYLSEQLQDSLNNLFEATNSFAGDVTHEIAENYRQAALSFPLHVWRAASQCEHRNCTDPSAHKLFFKTLKADGILDYILFPGDPSTHSVLRKHLGTLPSFPGTSMPPNQEHFWKLYTKEKEKFPKFAKGRDFISELELSL